MTAEIQYMAEKYAHIVFVDAIKSEGLYIGLSILWQHLMKRASCMSSHFACVFKREMSHTLM